MIGESISHYRILEKLGEGGMGVVYKAHDTKLDRDVALKFLPAHLTSYEQEKVRFIHEAKAASALDHPNICTIYEIDQTSDARLFIAMAYHEGETLNKKIERGDIKVSEAVDIGIQICEGLARAHDADIIHRDLKPANIMITTRGEVKIIDFGLAIVSGRPRLTKTGSTVGTAAYMSPEQAQGEKVDERTDIWSFGVLLYEMLTGRLPFKGEHEAAVLYEIVNVDPQRMSSVRPGIDEGLDRIVMECLAKNVDDRYQSIKEVLKGLKRFQREALKQRTEKVPSVPAFSSALQRDKEPSVRAWEGRKRGLLWTSVALALLIAGIGLGYFGFGFFRTTTQPSYQRLTFHRGIIWNARFSPDGKTIIYGAAWEGGNPEIFSLRLESPESRSLGLQNAALLSVSSKGEMAVLVHRRHLFFFLSRGTLARMPILGGAPREVLDDVQEADWSPDGTDIAVVHFVAGKDRLEYPVGNVLYETAGYISCPRISPRGDMIAFEDHQVWQDDRGWIAVVDRAGNKKTLSEEYTGIEGLAWSPSGDEVWFTASKAGEPAALYGVTLGGRQRVIVRAPVNLFLQDVTRDGRMLLASVDQHSEIFGLSPGEMKERNLSWFEFPALKSISSDGKAFCFVYAGEGSGLNYTTYFRKMDGSPAIRLGEGDGEAISPDKKWVLTVFMSPPRLGLLPTGSGQPRFLENRGIETYRWTAWFPDGKKILFVGHERGSDWRSYMQDIDSAAYHPVTPQGVSSQILSPDGKFLLASVRDTMVLYPVEGGKPRAVAGCDAGDEVAGWNADGRTVYVYQRPGLPIKVYRLDLATGRKELHKEVVPNDLTGILSNPRILVSSDGNAYIYSLFRFNMVLFLVDGLK